MLPKGFFVVSGSGVSTVSKLNAFDKALDAAGVSQCNLVPVSSILPSGAKKLKPKDIPPGSITFCVLARADGIEGETVGAGLAWSMCKNKKGKSYGIVAEDAGVKKTNYLKNDLKQKMIEMADSRKMTLSKMNYETTTCKVPEGSYGSAVTVLVYVL